MGRLAYGDTARKATAVALAILFTAGVVGALTVEPAGPALRVSTGAPATSTTTTTEVAVEAVPVEEPATTTTAAAVAAPASTAPRPAKKAAASAGPAGPKSGAYPGSLSFPFQAGRTSWSGRSNSFDLAVGIDKATPRTGEPVTFTFTATNAEHACCGFGVSFGDGGPLFIEDGNCPDEKGKPGTVTMTTKRAFNKAGRWRFTVSGLTLGCYPPGSIPLDGYIYAWIEVAPGGPTTSQGPSLPTFKAVDNYGPTPHDNDPSYVSVMAQATDVDGYIDKLVIDYGDGTTETYPEKAMGCRQTESGWPSESFMQTPTDPPPTHQYAARGTYKVTVTAYSRGCDGRDVQQASGSFDWVY